MFLSYVVWKPPRYPFCSHNVTDRKLITCSWFLKASICGLLSKYEEDDVPLVSLICWCARHHSCLFEPLEVSFEGKYSCRAPGMWTSTAKLSKKKRRTESDLWIEISAAWGGFSGSGAAENHMHTGGTKRRAFSCLCLQLLHQSLPHCPPPGSSSCCSH